MRRRRFLRSVGATGAAGGLAGLAGCVGTFGGNPNTTLGKPSGPGADGDYPYPTWGEEMPDVRFQNPLAGEAVSLADTGRPTFVTFFFTNCMTVCPGLIGALRNVQTDAVNEGYADAVRFLPVTFDPERDDGERFRAYAEKMNVSLDAGDWRFLRPESVAAAEEKINGNFGIGFEKQPAEDGNYMYNHLALVLLVNGEGYVERAYTGPSPNPTTFVEDLAKLRK
ncbi:SCO family protein [Halobium salinum]|uniref:SCO family protein n=1 Tax=Halobium salinum TaxID=1364940 RepID=A0ABD5P792_9EURY|nr:SCO family protein [Halobium salinum]